MKKKVLSVLLAVALSFSATGCGLTDLLQISGQEDEEEIPEQEPETDEATDEDSEEEKENGDEEEVSEEKPSFSNDGLVLVTPEAYDKNFLYIFGENGICLETFNLKDIEEALSLGSEENPTYLTYCDHIFFFSVYKYENNESYYKLIAFDQNSGETVDIIDWGTDSYNHVEVYDGKLRMTVSHDYNDWSVACYEKAEDSLTFTKSEPKYSKVYDQIGKNNVYNDEDNSRCYDRILDENDAFIVRSDDDFYLVRKRGTLEQIPQIVTSTSVLYADDDYVLTSEFDDNYKEIGWFCLNLANGDKKQIAEASDSDGIGYSDGVLYYNVKDESEFEHPTVRTYCYYPETDTTQLLKETEAIPATDVCRDYEYQYTINGNRLFYCAFKDGKAIVETAVNNGGTLDGIADTGCVIKEFTPYNFGSVEYMTRSEYCPDCGIPITERYGEYFILDPKFSDFSGDINDALYAEAEVFVNEKSDDTDWALEADCSEHQEYPEQFDITDEQTIENVGIIDDRYLYVDVSGYWYGGGAHGMPWRDQSLFDLTTGQTLKVSDFYTGTEEEFKELVAQKTVEDFNSYPDAENGGSPYFATDADKVYEEAYEYVRLDMNTYFREDGIVYYYYPYDMGSFADGFFDIFISYQELLGRSTLAE